MLDPPATLGGRLTPKIVGVSQTPDAPFEEAEAPANGSLVRLLYSGSVFCRRAGEEREREMQGAEGKGTRFMLQGLGQLEPNCQEQGPHIK